MLVCMPAIIHAAAKENCGSRCATGYQRRRGDAQRKLLVPLHESSPRASVRLGHAKHLVTYLVLSRLAALGERAESDMLPEEVMMTAVLPRLGMAMRATIGVVVRNIMSGLPGRVLEALHLQHNLPIPNRSKKILACILSRRWKRVHVEAGKGANSVRPANQA